MSNPLIASKSPVPQLDIIKEEHFLPAFEKAFDAIREKYEALRDNEDHPTFENSVLPFDKLFTEVTNLFCILGTLTNSARTDELEEIEETASKQFDALSKEIFQDQELAARFKAVYDQKDSLSLNGEDNWFLENIYRSFEDSAAFLDEKKQKRLQEIDSQLITTAKNFNDNVNDAKDQQSFLITDPNELAGVPADIVSGFKSQAKKKGHEEGWLFTPERLLIDGLLSVAENREFRQKIHEAMNKLGAEAPYDNAPVIKRMQELRHERAQLLGYDNYAEFKLAGTMAGSVKRVNDLLEKTVALAVPKFEEDMKTLQAWVDSKGGPKMEPWDVAYYTSEYKKETFQFDAEELSNHLEIENVFDGWLAHATKNMNVAFKETDAYPMYHPDVRVFETTDLDTGKKGLLAFDVFARSGDKRGGAWKSSLQLPEEGTDKLPIVTFNMNLVKPEEGKPALLSASQVETFYHEGGHCLNQIKGTETKYASRHGTGNGSDFVEIHSMIQENWAFEPEVLATYAFHHDTGKIVPNSVLEAMENSGSFMKAQDLLRLVQNAMRDLYFHSMDPSTFTNVTDIQNTADINSSYRDHARSYELTRFDHLFASGNSQYASGYYGYYWADVAQATAYEAFKEQGIYDPSLLQAQRKFYALGAGTESNEAYEGFTGKPAGDPRAVLANFGIASDESNDTPEIASKGTANTSRPACRMG